MSHALRLVRRFLLSPSTHFWVQRQLKSPVPDDQEIGLEQLIQRLRRRLDAVSTVFPF